MRRDTLLAHLIGLPAKTEILMQVGQVHVEILGVQPGGTLLPYPADLRDALIEGGLSPRDATKLTGPRREATKLAGSKREQRGRLR